MPSHTLITFEELEANSDVILARAEAGEHFDISVNGVVTVEIVPATSRKEAAIRKHNDH